MTSSLTVSEEPCENLLVSHVGKGRLVVHGWDWGLDFPWRFLKKAGSFPAVPASSTNLCKALRPAGKARAAQHGRLPRSGCASLKAPAISGLKLPLYLWVLMNRGQTWEGQPTRFQNHHHSVTTLQVLQQAQDIAQPL